MLNLYNNPWFNIKKRVPNARMRLFCFPYAGGSAQVFARWHEHLPADVEVIGIQYPGRASRFVEPLIPTCKGMVETLITNIMPYTDKPFAFFGHSNGGLVSFELARALQQQGIDNQLYHFISAKRAIHLPPIKAPMHQLPEDEFVEKIKALGGTPPEILAQKELMELFLPILRSDFCLSESFQYEGEHKLTCDASLLYGIADEDVPEAHVLRWQDLIAKPVNTKQFSGDHFFINSQYEQVLSYVNQRLLQLLAKIDHAI